MLELHESRIQHVATPRFQVVVSAVTPAVPTFLILAARIGTEQHASWLECGVQLSEHARQLLGRHMEQRSVCEDAVKPPSRQLEPVEILLPYLAAGVGTRHGGKAGCPIQPDSRVA